MAVKLKTLSGSAFKKIKKQLHFGESIGFQVISGSMEPIIQTGDWIEVRPLKKKPKRFDILVFWDGKILICHYLWHENQWTNSDGNNIYITRPLKRMRDDAPFTEERILGEVVSHKLSLYWKIRIVVKALLK